MYTLAQNVKQTKHPMLKCCNIKANITVTVSRNRTEHISTC